jgi:xanthine dehydrogenase accessory factor
VGLDLAVAVKGAGEMASGVAHRLHRAGLRVLFTETPAPLAVRRAVSFCEAVYDGVKRVEGVEAVLVADRRGVAAAWAEGRIPLAVDPEAALPRRLDCEVLVEATLAKRNTGVRLDDAPLVICLGPGYRAGEDCHLVVETNRGHDLGRLYHRGGAQPNTGVPGDIGGYTSQRVLRAPADGVFATSLELGESVEAGQTVAEVGGRPVRAGVSGVLRGLIRPGSPVSRGLKVGDVDPRGRVEYLHTISEKARAVGGSVLEAVMAAYNRG